MNRSERREALTSLKNGDYDVTALEMPVSMAIDLNRKFPVPGAEARLYEIRAQYGPGQTIRVQIDSPDIWVVE